MLSAGAECFEKYQATKWLSDDRDNPVVRQDDGEWAETVWGPRVIRAGFKYWAIVQPARTVSKLQMRKWIDRYRRLGVTVQMMETVEDAMAWLASTT